MASMLRRRRFKRSRFSRRFLLEHLESRSLMAGDFDQLTNGVNGTAIVGTVEDVTSVNNVAIFRSTDATTANDRIWSLDAIGNPIELFRGSLAFPRVSTVAGNSAYFAAINAAQQYTIMRTDGTVEGTSVAFNLGAQRPTAMIVQNDQLVVTSIQSSFVVIASGAIPAAGNIGTVSTLATTGLPNNLPSFAPTSMTSWRGGVYFSVANQLWKVLGQTATVVGSINSSIRSIQATDTNLMFIGESSLSQLWKSNGLSIEKVSDIRGYASQIGTQDRFQMKALGSSVYFVNNDGVNGNELWTSDGTTNGTKMVADGIPGSAGVFDNNLGPNGFTAPSPYAIFNGRFYIRRIQHLFVSDGTPQGTQIFKTLSDNLSLPIDMAPQVVGGWLLFSANTTANGTELWKSDGTQLGTQMVGDITGDATSGAPLLAAYADSKLFVMAKPATPRNDLFRIGFTANVDAPVGPTVKLGPNAIQEGLPIGSLVGFLRVDGDNADSYDVTYSLVDGTGATDNTSFTISGNRLLSNILFDSAMKSSLSVRVRATTPSQVHEQVVSVLVNDFEELSFPDVAKAIVPVGPQPRQSTLSSDGRLISFNATENTLVSTTNNLAAGVYIADTRGTSYELVSLQNEGRPMSGSFTSAISADGRYVAFLSTSSFGFPQAISSVPNVYLRDRSKGTTKWIGVMRNSDALSPSVYPITISDDGRYVAFGSRVANSFTGLADTRGLVVYDTMTGSYRMASIGQQSQSEDINAFPISMSGDGRLVGFVSALPLVAADTNAITDAYVRDMKGNTTSLISRSTTGSGGNFGSFGISISSDGSTVAFDSQANNLVEGDTNSVTDVFTYDWLTQSITLQSRNSASQLGNATSAYPQLSHDGKQILFHSLASNMDTNLDTDSLRDVFLRSLTTGETRLVNKSADLKGKLSGTSLIPDGDFSRDGRFASYMASPVVNGGGQTVIFTPVGKRASEIVLDNNRVVENLPAGTVVGTLTAKDQNQTLTPVRLMVIPTVTFVTNFTIENGQLITIRPLRASPTPYTVYVRAISADQQVFDQALYITATLPDGSVPEIIFQSSPIPENSPIGTVAGRLNTTGLPSTTPVVYSLIASASNPGFEIVGNEVRFLFSPNFEQRNSYSIRVRSTADTGQFLESYFTISISNVDEPPTRILTTSGTIFENRTPLALIGLLQTDDPDSSPTFSIETNEFDASGNPIFGASNALFARVPLNFEERSQYVITIKADDRAGTVLRENFVINVLNVNEAPIIRAIEDQEALRGQPWSFQLPPNTVSDPDFGDSLQYTVLSNGNALPNWLSFNPLTRTFSGTPPLDADLRYDISITVRDLGGLTANQSFAIHTVPFSILSTAIYAEDAPVGTVRGSIFAVGKGSSGFTSYSLVPGSGDTHNALFELVQLFEPTASQLRLIGSLDFETSPTLSVRVRATSTDGRVLEQAINVAVTNVDEPATQILPTSFSVVENVTNRITLTTNDPEHNEVASFVLLNNVLDAFGNPLYVISGSDLYINRIFNFESTTPIEPLRIEYFDAISGARFQQSFAVQVIDANDSPILPSFDRQIVRVGQPFSITMPPDATLDEDVGDELTFTLTSGNGSAVPSWLVFDPITRTLTGTPADGSAGAYSVRITARDLEGLESSTTIDIDVIQPAIVVTPNPLSEQPSSATIMNFAVVGWPGPVFNKFNLVPGDGSTDNSLFSQDPVTGSIVAIGPFDFESRSNLSVRVRAESVDGLIVEQPVTIVLSDANEAPLPSNVPLPDQVAQVGALFELALPTPLFIDPDASDSFIITATLSNQLPLPTWLTFNPTTMAFTGTPASADIGSYLIALAAKDVAGLVGTRTFRIDVRRTPVVTLVGTDGDDRFEVFLPDSSTANVRVLRNGAQIFTGSFGSYTGISLDGKLGVDRVIVNGRSLADIITITSQQFFFNGFAVNFANTERHTANSLGGNDTVQINQLPSEFVVDLGAGIDRLTAPATTNAWIMNGLGSGTLNSAVFTGTEHLVGGSLNDSFYATASGAWATSVSGGPGINTVDYSTRNSAVTVNLSNGTATGVSSVQLIQNIIGSRWNDNLTGDDRDNWIFGADGSDSISGLNGNDVLLGGRGDDRLTGGSGRDLLLGGSGLDDLLGGDDDDILIGDTAPTILLESTGGIQSTNIDAIMSVWSNRLLTYQDRVSRLTAGVGTNNAIKLTSGIVSDLSADRLFGQSGLDWFLGSRTDRRDRSNNEVETII